MPEKHDVGIEEIRSKIAELGKSNLFFFCKGILGYGKLTPTLHRELCWVIETPSYNKKLVMIPRGMFKTTIATISRTLQRIVQEPTRRVIIACNTMRIAESRLRIIKSHIESNPIFRWLYPEILPDITKTKWTAHEIIVNRSQDFADPTVAIAGVGSALAGRHCTDFVKDDIVDDKNSATPELIQGVIEWDATTVPIFDVPESGESEELVIGTPWSNVDVYSIKARESDYATYIRHALEDEQGKPDFATGQPIFPERYPRDRLEKIRKRIANDELFYCQYMCDPHGGDVADFKREDIQYFDTLPSDSEFSITVDPGGLKDNSDPTAFVIVGVDVRNDWYVPEAWKARLNPREIINTLFDLYSRYPSTHSIGIEMVAWQRSLHYFAVEEMHRRGIFLPIVELRTDTRVSKEMRIRGLIPRFSSKSIYLKSDMKDLEDELFQRVRTDDIKDALAYQLQVATRVPQPVAKIFEDPFSIECILAELAKKHRGSLGISYKQLSDSYTESFLVKGQLKEGNA